MSFFVKIKMCIQLSAEYKSHPGLLFFCVEAVMGERPTASSPGVVPSASANSLMQHNAKQRSCKKFPSLYLNILKRTENLL